jgi:hypothetical protein
MQKQQEEQDRKKSMAAKHQRADRTSHRLGTTSCSWEPSKSEYTCSKSAAKKSIAAGAEARAANSGVIVTAKHLHNIMQLEAVEVRVHLHSIAA